MSPCGNTDFGTVRRSAALGLLALSLASLAASAAEPLNVKLGLWEMSTTAATSGSMIPPALLAQMSAEQRARIEAAMKQRAGGGHTSSSKTCVTKEDLLRGSVNANKDEDQKNCTYRVVTQTATRMETHFHCTGEGARDGEMKMEAVSPEQLKGAVQVTTPEGKVTVQLAGRWLGSSCAGAKD
ncbi:MAG: DUF3617 domain-containing protein [Steroidobacteraceae bacterium]